MRRAAVALRLLLKHQYVGNRIKAIGKVEQLGSKLVLGVNEPKRIVVLTKKTTSS